MYWDYQRQCLIKDELFSKKVLKPWHYHTDFIWEISTEIRNSAKTKLWRGWIAVFIQEVGAEFRKLKVMKTFFEMPSETAFQDEWGGDSFTDNKLKRHISLSGSLNCSHAANGLRLQETGMISSNNHYFPPNLSFLIGFSPFQRSKTTSSLVLRPALKEYVDNRTLPCSSEPLARIFPLPEAGPTKFLVVTR